MFYLEGINVQFKFFLPNNDDENNDERVEVRA